MAGTRRGWEPVYRVVRRIPVGRVASYGQVAAIAGMPGAARQVGWALSALDGADDVPWQRVVNAQGRISGRGFDEAAQLQRSMLEAEGVRFNDSGRIDLERFGWRPRARKPSKGQRTSGSKRVKTEEAGSSRTKRKKTSRGRASAPGETA